MASRVCLSCHQIFDTEENGDEGENEGQADANAKPPTIRSPVIIVIAIVFTVPIVVPIITTGLIVTEPVVVTRITCYVVRHGGKILSFGTARAPGARAEKQFESKWQR